jgi:ferredoxin-NADP reductase/Na+-translocating ferredoxin:NAD+ oxidoreductase RnfD subunit
MLKFIDHYLDRVTMYRLVLYYLIAILVVALGLSAFRQISYSPASILISMGFLLVTCLITNMIFSYVFEAPTNIESSYITALILACILTPAVHAHDFPLLFFAGTLAIGSKYMFAIPNKHIFNPAAIAVVLTALWMQQSASWWVGTQYMAPVVLLGGLLMVRKIRRFDMIYAFITSALVSVGVFAALNGHDLIHTIQTTILSTSLLFFAFVMVTEPLTSPHTKQLQVWFAVIVGFLFAPQVHIGSLYFTPELALVVGNIFAFIVSPKIKEKLVLRQSMQIATNTMAFIFQPSRKLAFEPGQYMEFTLPHTSADARGNRRYFTVASSPTEDTLQLGVKFYENSSTFKQHLLPTKVGDSIMAGQLAGDFTLPKNKAQKLAFIAGGVGITPFRSMVKYMVDTNEQRDVTLFYSNKTVDEIAYAEVFDTAASIGLRTIYTLAEVTPENWVGEKGFVNADMIQRNAPDYLERMFYLSGPQGMVSAMEGMLMGIGVKGNMIKKDFFPGLV